MVVIKVSMEMTDPESSELTHLFVVEYTYAMWRSEETVSNNHIGKVLKALFLGKPLFEGMLKHMCSYFDGG